MNTSSSDRWWRFTFLFDWFSPRTKGVETWWSDLTIGYHWCILVEHESWYYIPTNCRDIIRDHVINRPFRVGPRLNFPWWPAGRNLDACVVFFFCRKDTGVSWGKFRQHQGFSVCKRMLQKKIRSVCRRWIPGCFWTFHFKKTSKLVTINRWWRWICYCCWCCCGSFW